MGSGEGELARHVVSPVGEPQREGSLQEKLCSSEGREVAPATSTGTTTWCPCHKGSAPQTCGQSSVSKLVWATVAVETGLQRDGTQAVPAKRTW